MIPEKSGSPLRKRAIRLSRSSCFTDRGVYPLRRSSATESGLVMTPLCDRSSAESTRRGAKAAIDGKRAGPYAPFMATKPIARFDDLLSTRGRIGRDGPAAPTRPVLNALYEFGGGFPDPASFPYEGVVEATARMIKVEGAEALTYGDHQGYRGLRELVCHKYDLFEGLKVAPENLIISNGSGHALSLAFSAFL